MRKFSPLFLFVFILSFHHSATAADSVIRSDKNWMVRVRALGVLPDESADLNIGGSVNIDDSVVPELDITYFFDKNWATELVLGVTPHSGKTTPSNIDLGSVWLLPPTLTLQYHFELENKWKPYVGAGVNYTHFFGVDKGPTITSISYDDSFGPALQAGIDVPIKDNWYFNLDVKKVWISTDVRVNGAVTGSVDIDPWLVGVGVGYRF
jgi:outer membrane protein